MKKKYLIAIIFTAIIYLIWRLTQKFPPQIITPSTKIIYNYDNYTESKLAPNFLIGMNEHDFKNVFSDWNVKDFSREKIVMQKNIAAKRQQYYIIGIKNGYVAVFFHDGRKKSLKELTNTPIESLSSEDKNRLEKGIKISDEDKLITIMQDYES